MNTADRTPTRFMSRFSPQIRNVEFQREVFAVFGQILIGKINHTTARVRIIQKLRELKYEAGCGFLHETDDSPMPDRPTLDLIDLMIRTEIALTRNERRCREAQDESHLFLFPAWELVLLGSINKGEDIPETRPGEWERRWRAAGNRVRWVGARKARMMASNDSPIWQALGDGAGGFDDGLKYPFPPFALKSKMDWRAVPRAEWHRSKRWFVRWACAAKHFTKRRFPWWRPSYWGASAAERQRIQQAWRERERLRQEIIAEIEARRESLGPPQLRPESRTLLHRFKLALLWLTAAILLGGWIASRMR